MSNYLWINFWSALALRDLSNQLRINLEVSIAREEKEFLLISDMKAAFCFKVA
jgi:hypothetical protein